MASAKRSEKTKLEPLSFKDGIEFAFKGDTGNAIKCAETEEQREQVIIIMVLVNMKKNVDAFDKKLEAEQSKTPVYAIEPFHLDELLHRMPERFKGSYDAVLKMRNGKNVGKLDGVQGTDAQIRYIVGDDVYRRLVKIGATYSSLVQRAAEQKERIEWNPRKDMSDLHSSRNMERNAPRQPGPKPAPNQTTKSRKTATGVAPF